MPNKTFQEVVRGIRTAKEPTAYITEVINEIHDEIKGTDRNDKVVSLQKLIYLNLIGYTFDWAEFHVIEVMSQPLYKERRVGFLAATVLIRPESELFILCANTLKKAFLSKNKYDVGLALDCFSMVVTEELARDLLPDILNLLKSKRAFVRRKAVLCLFRIYKQYPAAMEESYDQLVSLLGDSDLTVQSSAVSVITELAREDPSRYQNLAPIIYNLLNVDNTWILIKVIKLLVNLVPKEPRLAKKILEPLVNIVRTTETKSLLYETMMGVAQCLIYLNVKSGSKLEKEVGKISELLMSKFMEFVENNDPNLKYLGLCGLLRLVKIAPTVVAKKSFVFVSCLKENDSTIRVKALNLIKAIANPKNLKNLVEDLVNCLHSGIEIEMKEEIISGIIDMSSRDTYANTTDFRWYVSVLVDLSYTKGTSSGDLISNQLIDVALRVPEIRLFTVNAVLPLLLDTSKVSESMQSVLIHGAAWVVGEYSEQLQQDQIANIFASLASPSMMYLPSRIQATMLQSLLQVSLRFICSLGSASEQATAVRNAVIAHAEMFLSNQSDEVRYRASLLKETLQVTATFDNEVVAIEKHEGVQKEIENMNNARKEMTSMNEKTDEVATVVDTDINIGGVIENEAETPKEEEEAEETPKEETPKEEEVTVNPEGIHMLSDLLKRLTEELMPISAKAQGKVKVPEGLDLDTPIASFDLPKEIEHVTTVTFVDGPLFTYKGEESGRKHRKHRSHRHEHESKKDQFYLESKEDEDDEEGEVQVLSFEDVGVPVETKEEKEEETPKFTVIRDAEESSTEEEKKEDERSHKHRSHRHRSEHKEEKVEEKPEEKKHRRHHHH